MNYITKPLHYFVVFAALVCLSSSFVAIIPPLHQAAADGQTPESDALLRQVDLANFNYQHYQQNLQLHAAYYAQTPESDELLRQVSRTITNYQQSLLMLAAQQGCLDAVNRLIESGADICNGRHFSGKPVLGYAIDSDNAHVVSTGINKLIDTGTNLNNDYDVDGLRTSASTLRRATRQTKRIKSATSTARP